ncbi:uncharacterized protein EV420DRAFT_1635851 [Desarmillaria tabescens]|uniref:Ribonuclease H1 N-terminal domain-containing protein n=1 Tax=Armillaria tabescens TaxID=1929756 RepID=A0AA39NJJ7_ARMTA|nr:uncharacterized protein EV420DRAFT_1635851 [Desarmillaria tabescens]KAK0466810.1 hypothetical protein EV420DRAFT_1635851 [Desarmillaria tabescens]
MTQQSQLNLTPQALAALLEALNALNLNANNASTSTSAPGEPEGEPAPAPIAESTQGAVAGSAVASPSPAQAPGNLWCFLQHCPVWCCIRSLEPSSLLSMQPGRSSSVLLCPSYPTATSTSPLWLPLFALWCAFNPAVGQSSEAWYVVTAGREVGIFSNWEVIQPLVSGIAHACHCKYKTCAEAEEAFQTALSQGKVCVL